MCTSKRDSFYATFMSCMYCSKNRTQYYRLAFVSFVHSVQNRALQLAQLTHNLFVYTQLIKTLHVTKTDHTYKQLMEMTKLVWFTGAKNVLGQTLYGNTLTTLLDDDFARLKMALHPIVVYHKESNKLAEKLFCCISDDLEHDTEFGFEMQRELVKILKKVPTVTEVDFFLTDVQNYKNMLICVDTKTILALTQLEFYLRQAMASHRVTALAVQ